MGTKNSVIMFQHICLVNLEDQPKLLLFELLFLFVVSQKKITKLSSWELFWFCESHLQWLLFLSTGQSLSNYHTAGATTALPKLPSASTSSVLAEGLDSYSKDIVFCVNCIKDSPTHPHCVHLYIYLFYLRESLVSVPFQG